MAPASGGCRELVSFHGAAPVYLQDQPTATGRWLPHLLSRAGAKSKLSIPRSNPITRFSALRITEYSRDLVTMLQGSGGRDSPDPMYPSPICRHQLELQVQHNGHHSPVRRNGSIWRRIGTGAGRGCVASGDRKTLARYEGGQLTYLLDIVINC